MFCCCNCATYSCHSPNLTLVKCFLLTRPQSSLIFFKSAQRAGRETTGDKSVFSRVEQRSYTFFYDRFELRMVHFVCVSWSLWCVLDGRIPEYGLLVVQINTHDLHVTAILFLRPSLLVTNREERRLLEHEPELMSGLKLESCPCPKSCTGKSIKRFILI